MDKFIPNYNYSINPDTGAPYMCDAAKQILFSRARHIADRSVSKSPSTLDLWNEAKRNNFDFPSINEIDHFNEIKS